jgi:hypothetical protein
MLQVDKGNIFCLNRNKSPMLAVAFEALSFPSMIQQVRAYVSFSSKKVQNSRVGFFSILMVFVLFHAE